MLPDTLRESQKSWNWRVEGLGALGFMLFEVESYSVFETDIVPKEVAFMYSLATE